MEERTVTIAFSTDLARRIRDGLACQEQATAENYRATTESQTPNKSRYKSCMETARKDYECFDRAFQRALDA